MLKPNTRSVMGRSGLVVAGLAVTSVGWTQTSDGSLEEVRITAQRLEDTLPEQLAQSGVKVDVISDEEIQNGTFPDVATALENLAPGLFILPKNGPFDYDAISMLGSRTEDVLFLIDGVRINNRLYGSTPPLDTMSSGIVDHIEVLDGGQALFYGTQALAGAVNIVTKPFTKDTSGSATIGVDSNSGKHIDAHVGDSTDFGQFVLYGSSDRSPGYKAFPDDEYQPSSTHRHRGYDVTTLGGKYGFDFSDQLRLEASWQRTDADLDYALPYLVARDVNSRREDIATIKLDYQVAPDFGLYLKSYYHNWHTDYDTYYNDVANPGTIDVIYQDAFWGYKDRGINVLGKWDVGQGLSAYFGYDMQDYGGRDQVLVIEQHNENTQAGFAQLRYSPVSVHGLTLAAGARYNAPNVGQKDTIWNVSGRYEMPLGLYVNGEAGTNFRLPSAEELYANDPEDELGNANLKPENSRSFDLSFGQKVRVAGDQAIHWEVTGFARDIDNLIDCDGYDAATDQCVFINVPGTVRTRGAMLEADTTLGSQLSANINYTYTRSLADGEQLDNIPTGLVKAGLDYHSVGNRFGATILLNYVGNVQRSLAGTEYAYGKYATLDISARIKLDRKEHQQINLSLQNVFNRQYGEPSRGWVDTVVPYTTPYIYTNLGLPRTFTASYTYKF